MQSDLKIIDCLNMVKELKNNNKWIKVKIIDHLSMVTEPDYSKKVDYDSYIDKLNELTKKYNVKFLVGDLII